MEDITEESIGESFSSESTDSEKGGMLDLKPIVFPKNSLAKVEKSATKSEYSNYEQVQGYLKSSLNPTLKPAEPLDFGEEKPNLGSMMGTANLLAKNKKEANIAAKKSNKIIRITKGPSGVNRPENFKKAESEFLKKKTFSTTFSFQKITLETLNEPVKDLVEISRNLLLDSESISEKPLSRNISTPVSNLTEESDPSPIGFLRQLTGYVSETDMAARKETAQFLKLIPDNEEFSDPGIVDNDTSLNETQKLQRPSDLSIRPFEGSDFGIGLPRDIERAFSPESLAMKIDFEFSSIVDKLANAREPTPDNYMTMGLREFEVIFGTYIHQEPKIDFGLVERVLTHVEDKYDTTDFIAFRENLFTKFPNIKFHFTQYAKLQTVLTSKSKPSNDIAMFRSRSRRPTISR